MTPVLVAGYLVSVAVVLLVLALAAKPEHVGVEQGSAVIPARSSRPRFSQVAANIFGSGEWDLLGVAYVVTVLAVLLVVLAWAALTPVQLRDVLLVV